MGIKQYLDVAYRRRWLILVPTVLGLAGGIALLPKLPRVYEASTTILVLPPPVSKELVQSAIPNRVDLSSLTVQVMSRTYLETVVREFGMVPEKASEKDIETACARLKSKVDLEYDTRTRAWFRIFVQDEDPQRAAGFTNRLAALFIEQNSEQREGSAKEVLQFLETDRNAIKKDLDAKETELAAYKSGRPEALPSQSDTFIQLQQNARETLRQAELEISRRETRIDQLHSQGPSAIPLPSGSRPAPSDSPFVRLTQLQAELRKLLETFTEKHPDVQSKKQEVASLLAEHPELATSPSPDDPLAGAVAAVPRTPEDLEIARLQREIQGFEEQKRVALADIDRYSGLLRSIPSLQQVLIRLEREAEELRGQFKTAESKVDAAERTLKIEQANMGEQFRVQDEAKVPTRPSKPVPAQVILMGLLAGLGVGAGISLLLELLNHSFRSEDDFQRAYPDVVLLAAIPNLQETARTAQKSHGKGRTRQAVGK